MLQKIWHDSPACVVVAGGPSLTQADVDHCRGKARVLVINDGYRLAPWADALYACDARWWDWHPDALDFEGLKLTMNVGWPAMKVHPKLTAVPNLGDNGFSTSAKGVYTGRNSGYMALQLAIILGARRVLLLGYDMSLGPQGQHHWFGKHPNNQAPPVEAFLRLFSHCTEPLKKSGVEVVNCSRSTKLELFPKSTIKEAL